MTRIGVLSDSHLNHAPEAFKTMVQGVFRDVDILIHAGDMVSRAVYDYLCNWDLRAVKGNMDDFDLDNLLPKKRIEVVEGRKIGIIHGRGAPYSIEQVVLSEFTDVDIIVFGHSHAPAYARRGDLILFNPGALRNPAIGKKTVGIIEIGAEITCRHVDVP
jgi:uncharacterized protein